MNNLNTNSQSDLTFGYDWNKIKSEESKFTSNFKYNENLYKYKLQIVFNPDNIQKHLDTLDNKNCLLFCRDLLRRLKLELTDFYFDNYFNRLSIHKNILNYLDSSILFYETKISTGSKISIDLNTTKLIPDDPLNFYSNIETKELNPEYEFPLKQTDFIILSFENYIFPKLKLGLSARKEHKIYLRKIFLKYKANSKVIFEDSKIDFIQIRDSLDQLYNKDTIKDIYKRFIIIS